MKRYFLSVILAALFGGICEAILPEGNATRTHLKLVTGICVLSVLVLPMGDLIAEMGEFVKSIDLDGIMEDAGEYDEIFEGALSRYSAEEIGRYVGDAVTREFSLPEGTCRATAVLNADGTLSRVLIVLSGTAILSDPDRIEQYVNERLACPCDVATE